MKQNKYIIEIATSDYTTTASAVEGGADRIELCANLSEGGTTPSFGTMLQCRAAFETPIYVMIRPRGGDFLYSEEEYEIMKKDVIIAKDLGCDGVVFGMLKRDGQIDIDQTIRLLQMAYPMRVTFHRAFDRCKEPFEALEQLIEIGCERILTSGQQPTVPEGVDLVAELNRVADHRIIIMPGSGIRTENIRMVAEKTGCKEFHASLRGKVKSKMDFCHPAFRDGSENYLNNAIDKSEIKKLRTALNP
jgi:copper homeostasis protein